MKQIYAPYLIQNNQPFMRAHFRSCLTLTLVAGLAATCLFSAITLYAGVRVARKAQSVARGLVQRADDLRKQVAPTTGEAFTQWTGLAWPDSAHIVTSYSEDYAFDWSHYMILTADHTDLEAWLAGPPPWSNAQWQRGPVPYEALKVNFGMEAPIAGQQSDGTYTYHASDARLIRLLTSANLYYTAKEYCCENLKFHSGDLLIIDLEQDTVWVASWDY